MKRLITTILATLALASLTGATTDDPLEYEFNEVRSKVTIDTANGSSRIENGAIAHAGDEVRTGWRGRATVAVEARASRFEIYPRSRVRLASEQPGVIVLLERGRLKAMFDAITGNDERIVETPGAILAVRGTRYGVEVDASGNAAISVFEGMVEVRPRDSSLQTMLVRPGEVVGYGLHMEPKMMGNGMTERMWTDHGGTRSMSGGPDRGSMMSGSKGSGHGSNSGTRKPH